MRFAGLKQLQGVATAERTVPVAVFFPGFSRQLRWNRGAALNEKQTFEPVFSPFCGQEKRGQCATSKRRCRGFFSRHASALFFNEWCVICLISLRFFRRASVASFCLRSLRFCEGKLLSVGTRRLFRRGNRRVFQRAMDARRGQEKRQSGRRPKSAKRGNRKARKGQRARKAMPRREKTWRKEGRGKHRESARMNHTG